MENRTLNVDNTSQQQNELLIYDCYTSYNKNNGGKDGKLHSNINDDNKCTLIHALTHAHTVKKCVINFN